MLDVYEKIAAAKVEITEGKVLGAESSLIRIRENLEGRE